MGTSSPRKRAQQPSILAHVCCQLLPNGRKCQLLLSAELLLPTGVNWKIYFFIEIAIVEVWHLGLNVMDIKWKYIYI